MTTIYNIEYQRNGYWHAPSKHSNFDTFTDYGQACEQARGMLRLESVTAVRVLEVTRTEVFRLGRGEVSK